MPPSSEVTLLDSTEHLAFISYSSRDVRSAISLHKALERTSYPDSPWWGPKKLRPIFRDRDDLKAGSDLTSLIKNALKQSKCLVVVCSQNTPMSDWVNAEISYFCSLKRQNRVFLFVVGPPETETSKLIPASLQPMPIPLFADSRASGDGWRKAVAKIAAGIIDVPLDSILQRYKRESARRTAWRAGGAVLILLLGITAHTQYSLSTSRRLAHEAESLTASQIDLALLLGVEAYRVFPTEEAESALRSILNSVQYLSGILYLDGNVTKVVYSPKGNFLVSGDSTGAVTFRTAKKPWSVIRSVTAHGAPISSLLFDLKGNRLISADENGNIILWTYPFETGRKLSIPMTQGTCCLSLHPAGTMLAISRDSKIETWDIDKEKAIPVQIELWTDPNLNSPDDDITVLAFGRFVGNSFAAGGERSAQIFTTGDWKFYKNLQVPQGWINLDEPPTLEAVDFSKTGILAGGWSNGLVFFWDLQTFEWINPFPGRKASSNPALQFHPYGDMLAVSDPERGLVLWNMPGYSSNGENKKMPSEITRLQGLSTPAKALSFSPDGDDIAASGEKDSRIMIWTLVEKKLDNDTCSFVGAAQELAGRQITRSEKADYMPLAVPFLARITAVLMGASDAGCM